MDLGIKKKTRPCRVPIHVYDTGQVNMEQNVYVMDRVEPRKVMLMLVGLSSQLALL